MTIAPPAPKRGRGAPAVRADAAALPASGVGRRLLAYLVDAAAVAAPAVAVWFTTASLLLTAVVAAEVAIGIVVWEARSGRTVGKQILGIRAAQVETRLAPGLARELVRAILLGLAHLVAGVGQFVLILSAAGDRTRLGRGWHDRVARTRVVDVRPGVRAAAAASAASAATAAAPRRAVLPPVPGAPAGPPPPPAPTDASGRPVPTIPAAPVGVLPSSQAGLPFPTPAPHETTSGQEARRIAADIMGQQPPAATPPPFAARLDGAGPPTAQIPAQPAAPWTPPSVAPAPVPPAQPPVARPAPAQAPPAPVPPPAAVPPQPTQQEPEVAEEALTVVYVLTLDSGRTITITGSGVLGRRPQPRAGETVDHVVEVDDPGRSLSRTHIRFGIADGAFWVEDAGSANGTWVATPDGATAQVRAGSRVEVVSGGEIRLGERKIAVERWQA